LRLAYRPCQRALAPSADVADIVKRALAAD
jgi:hypothetical protein